MDQYFFKKTLQKPHCSFGQIAVGVFFFSFWENKMPAFGYPVHLHLYFNGQGLYMQQHMVQFSAIATQQGIFFLVGRFGSPAL